MPVVSWEYFHFTHAPTVISAQGLSGPLISPSSEDAHFSAVEAKSDCGLDGDGLAGRWGEEEAGDTLSHVREQGIAAFTG